MRFSGSTPALVGAIGLAACVPEMKVDTRVAQSVQVSKSEPGPWCRPLGAVEATSEMGTAGYVSAYRSLQAEVASLGGNYAVIDHVAGARLAAEAWRETVIGGRAFACPLVDNFPKVRVLVSDPPEQVSDGETTVMHPTVDGAQR